jgi:cysteinyl-tRNA synthetase
VLEKFDAEGLRLFLLGTHYRRDFNFSDLVLGEAELRLGYLYETLEKADRLAAGAAPAGGDDLLERCRLALDDDFGTPGVLGLLAEAFSAANVLCDLKGKKTPTQQGTLAAFALAARAVGETLGLLQRPPRQALLALRTKAAARRGIEGAAVEAKLAERTAARKGKDFARSDSIRDELLAAGVAIMDGPEGTSWKVTG